MTTLAEITERVLEQMAGYVDQSEQTHLTEAVTAGGLLLKVDEPRMLSQGLIEIGDELLWASRVDNNARQVTIPPYGRGYRSTTAASHPEGAAVINNPKFPRSSVVRAINDCIDGLYPDLYRVKSADLTYTAAQVSYELPADAQAVHRVSWEDIGPSRAWRSLYRWNFDPNADQSAFPSGRSLDLWQAPVPGRTVRVVYLAAPGTMSDPADDFTTATGLGADAVEAVVWGACYRLAGMLTAGRVQVQAIEATLRAQVVDDKTGLAVAQQFHALYQQSLAESRRRLLQQDPTGVHFRYA